MAQFSKIRYIIVGGSAYVVHYAILGIAGLLLASSTVLSVITFLSFLGVSVGSYFAHRFFTFKSSASYAKSSIGYFAVVFSGSVLSALVTYGVVLSLGNYWIVPGQIVFSGLWAFVSATLLSRFVF